jgi:ABC-2 type transport system ATP-binding protein
VIADGTSDELKQRLGGDVLDVKVRNHTDLSRTVELLTGVGAEKPQLDERDNRITIAVGQNAGVDVLLAAARKIDEAGIQIDDLGIRRPSLDDVFLSLTGHVAETEPSESSTPATGRGRKAAK